MSPQRTTETGFDIRFFPLRATPDPTNTPQRGRPQVPLPLRKLYRAVLETAVYDIFDPKGTATAENRRDAAAWIRPKAASRITFTDACESLGFDTSAVRSRLLAHWNKVCAEVPQLKHRLDADDFRRIRRLRRVRPALQIAKMYGISESRVGQIVRQELDE